MSVPANTANERPWPSEAYGWYVVFVLCVCAMVAFIDRQIINLLVEDIKADLAIIGAGSGGLSVAAGVTVRGVELQRGFNVHNSYYPTVAVAVDPMTLVRNVMSTPTRAEKTVRNFVKQVF